ncbi:hypothetical protein SBA3_3880002 [Candidatus Sulfopaludibacter sp. SbA3]|nr:hypothetical protein SBA3_3880002 [Candidatus Sulfopaludibacter sp. SbA3]
MKFKFVNSSADVINLSKFLRTLGVGLEIAQNTRREHEFESKVVHEESRRDCHGVDLFGTRS